MSSYFANSYPIPDLRNGTPDHYATQGVNAQVNSDPTCDPSLRQAIPQHYGGAPTGHSPQGMPYPRFPPYDRLDIRAVGNAGVNYYSQNAQPGINPIVDGQGYRPNSPTVNSMGAHMAPNQTPVSQYSSCKLQAAAAAAGPGSPNGGPPNHHRMDQTNHHMAAPNHHQNHMMYNNVNQQHHQVVNVSQHQQAPPPPPQPQQQQQQQQPTTNPAAALPSPLYPWMRSQFGKYFFIFCFIGKLNISVM